MTRLTRRGSRALGLGLLLGSLASCGDALLSDEIAAELGQRLCAVGHPNATCARGRRIGSSSGGCGNRDKRDRWVDIAVPYTRRDAPHEMVVRVRLKSVSPCRVAVDVQADDGPNPVLLDNPVTSKLVGDALCRHVEP